MKRSEEEMKRNEDLFVWRGLARWREALLLGGILSCASGVACQEDVPTTEQVEQQEACADGEGAVFVEEDGTKLCVISQKIIEVGFDCPVGYVGLQSYGLLAICGGGASIPSGKIDFNYSDALRRDLAMVYPQYVPRGACVDTLCTGNAICILDSSCEFVTSATSARFMCADGVCELEPASEELVCDAQCDATCPTSQSEWVCGEDGGRYCHGCTAACYGVAVAQAASTCPAPPTSRVEQCIVDCGATCGATEEEWFCATDSRYYCSACEVQCIGRAITAREQCAGALPPNQSGM